MTVQMEIKTPQEAINILNNLLENEKNGGPVRRILLAPSPKYWHQHHMEVIAAIILTLAVGFLMAIVAVICKSHNRCFQS